MRIQLELVSLQLTERESEPICNLGALILCMKAAKEGSRNILLVSSRAHAIQVRDANDGLLLRTLSDDLCGISIYDMLIEGSTIYCGSNRHEIFAIDFTVSRFSLSLIAVKTRSFVADRCLEEITSLWRGNNLYQALQKLSDCGVLRRQHLHLQHVERRRCGEHLWTIEHAPCHGSMERQSEFT